MPDLSLGQLIKNTRIKRDISINQLTSKVGSYQRHIVEIERDIHTPTLDLNDKYISQIRSNFTPKLSEEMLIKISDVLGLSKNHIMSKVGKLPASIIHGFLEFPEEIDNAEKYFTEKFAYRKTQEGQAKMRNNPT